MKPLMPYLGMVAAAALAVGCAMETETEMEESALEEVYEQDEGVPIDQEPGPAPFCGRGFEVGADGKLQVPVLCDPYVEQLPGTDEEEMPHPLHEVIPVEPY